jgi:hypothetical protein
MPMPRDVFTISQDQFDKLVELLTPINQLAVAQLALMPQPANMLDDPAPSTAEGDIRD